MNAAPVPIPSQLAPEADEWVRVFAAQFVAEVAAPLFGAPDVDAFQEQLPEALVRGAILRYRWLNGLGELSPEASAALSDEWTRPPSPVVLEDLQLRAERLLGDERSFQLRRALGLLFTDTLDSTSKVQARLSGAAFGPRPIVEMARLAEAGVPHDVLSIAWMGVLYGDVPTPRPDVASAGAAALLSLTATRLGALRAVLEDQVDAREVGIAGGEFLPAWVPQHRVLLRPLLLLLGLAIDDPAVNSISLRSHSDPEDARLTIVELGLVTAGYDDARLRLEERALRIGVLGALTDEHGGTIAITEAPEE